MNGGMTSSRRRIALEAPYDLARSLLLRDHGRANPTIARPAPGELLRAQRTPEGPASVHLRVHAGAVEAEAWGPGRAWLLDRLPTSLGLDDRPPVFAGRLGRLQRHHPGIRQARAPDVFDLLVGYVIRQRVAWRDAVASQAQILRAHAEAAPGPVELGLRLPVSAAQWLAMSTADLAAFGLERKRAKTILGLAARADRIRSLAADEPERFGVAIESFTGVGPWTRAMAQAHGLGDPDAVPLGDYDLPSLVAWFFAREPRADDRRMLELLEPHRGHRFRVIHLLWAAGLHAPRFGPRIRGVRP
jgi:3-methyladenine DNA glycosylase/8-oxoguanine DNA glycosylase